MLRHLVNFILAVLPPSRCFALRAWLLKRCGVRLGNDSKVCGGGWIYGRGALHIGEGTWLSPRVIFYTHLDAPIRIGESCDIGPGVRFITGSHRFGPAGRRAGEGFAAPIVIGRGTWLGAEVSVLAGVEVGEGCVIAAGAVIVDDIPPHTMAAGIPARVKRTLPQ